VKKHFKEKINLKNCISCCSVCIVYINVYTKANTIFIATLTFLHCQMFFIQSAFICLSSCIIWESNPQPWCRYCLNTEVLGVKNSFWEPVCVWWWCGTTAELTTIFTPVNFYIFIQRVFEHFQMMKVPGVDQNTKLGIKIIFLKYKADI